jgi:glycerol-3-phosphate dehydrogenase (NAD(P)+)
VRIAVLGAGAWGSALAISLAGRHDILLWTRATGAAEALARDRESPYLPGCKLPANVRVERDMASAVAGADLILVATATSGLRPVAEALARISPGPRLLWACKGFESASQRLPHEIVAETLPGARTVGALSGPSFALEVARGLPTALVLASADAAFASATAAALNTARLRLYSSGDVKGVELGGAVKNVIAIASGICDGLELGRNARAALVTRGLAEIVRLGVAMGGQAETFMGLAGVGDLVLTCTGDLSRNRDVGLRLARGQGLERILQELGHVAEGVHSAKAATAYAKSAGVEMPIATAVCEVLFEGLPPRTAVDRLLTRDPRREQE